MTLLRPLRRKTGRRGVLAGLSLTSAFYAQASPTASDSTSARLVPGRRLSYRDTATVALSEPETLRRDPRAKSCICETVSARRAHDRPRPASDLAPGSLPMTDSNSGSGRRRCCDPLCGSPYRDCRIRDWRYLSLAGLVGQLDSLCSVEATSINSSDTLTIPEERPTDMSTPSSPSSSSSSSAFSSSDSSPLSTAPTTAPSSPKLSASGLAGLPSPFYPPTLAAREGFASSHQPDPLPSHFPPLPSTSQRPIEADAVTKGTPDEWIPRDERLVRLTGASTPSNLMRRVREELTVRAFATASHASHR